MPFARRPKLESLEDRWSPASLAALPAWTTPDNPASGAVALTVCGEPANREVAIEWQVVHADARGDLLPLPATQSLRDAALAELALEHAGEPTQLVTDWVFTG